MIRSTIRARDFSYTANFEGINLNGYTFEVEIRDEPGSGIAYFQSSNYIPASTTSLQHGQLDILILGDDMAPVPEGKVFIAVKASLNNNKHETGDDLNVNPNTIDAPITEFVTGYVFPVDGKHYGAPVADTAELAAIPSANLSESSRRFVTEATADFFWNPAAIAGGIPPDDQVGGVGFWVTTPAAAPGADGADGAQGPQGIQGPAGADGADGNDGAQGPQGIQGPAGNDGSDGADGNDGAQGTQGPAGADGTDGNTILSGTGPPGAGLGVDGDYYMDEPAMMMYGKKDAGAWPAGVDLIPVGGDSDIVIYDFSGSVGGASNAELITAAEATFIVDGTERLLGDQDFGARQIVGSLNKDLSFPTNRTNPVKQLTGALARYNGRWQSSGRDESDGNDFGSSPAGDAGAAKYDMLFTQQAGRGPLRDAQVIDGYLLIALYFPDIETQQGGSPWYTGGGSGSPWTHQQCYMDIGNTSQGGIPGSGNTPATAKSEFSVFIGHLMPMEHQTVTNTLTAMTGSGDTRVANIADTSSYIVGRAMVLYTEDTPTTTFYKEALITDPYADGEFVEITAVGGSTVTYKQLLTPNGDQIGSSFAHTGGTTRAMMIGVGQAAPEKYNWLFNYTTYCPADKNGRNYSQFNAWWIDTYKNYDSAGNLLSPAPVYVVVSHDVTMDAHFGQRIALADGDTVDDGIIGGKNAIREGQTYALSVIRATFPNMPQGTGGTEELVYRGAHFAQMEYVEDNPQGGTDESKTFYNWSEQFYRLVKATEQEVDYPSLNSVVTKIDTGKYPDGTGSTSVDAFVFIMASCLLAGARFCPKNNPSIVDTWYERFAVDIDGVGIPNTAPNQAAIQSRLEWLGPPTGRLQCVSDVVLPAPSMTYDFTDPGTTDELGFTKGGNTSGTLAFNAGAGRLELTDINLETSIGGERVQSDQLMLPGDEGDDIVIILTMYASEQALIQLSVGQNVASRRHMVYIDEEDTTIVLSRKMDSNDTIDDWTGSMQFNCAWSEADVYIKKMVVYKGADINPKVYARTAQNGIVLVNATDRQVVVPLPDTYDYLDLPADERTSFAINGASVTSITLPAFSAETLYKKTPTTIPDDFKALVDTLPRVNSAAVVGDQVRIRVPAGDASKWQNFKVYPEVDVAPVSY